MFTSASFIGLAPILVMSIGAVLLMLQISVRRRIGYSYAITLTSFVLAAASTQFSLDVAPLQITPLLRADDYALFFSLLFCLGGVVTTVISRDYLDLREGQNEEYFLLLLLSTLGAVTLAYATHLASLLLGLELLGVALYALIAYPDKQTLPLEAAIKYLVLSGAASAIFLFGFALLYTVSGQLAYADMQAAMAQVPDSAQPILLAGAAMVVTGLGFKLSAVPFHMWTPDVYEGAPAPVSGFLAAISKTAVFAAILRWWLEAGFFEFQPLLTAVTVLAVASMLVGNVLALLQENVKRILAYSSIAHVGYLLIVLVACGVSPEPSLAIEAACYYLVAYAATTLAAFTLLGLLSSTDPETERDQLGDMVGLFWRQPGLSLLFSVALLSLAGIPLTAGFIGKFYLFSAGVDASLWLLLAVLVLGSAISIFYYLRIIFTMSRQADTGAETGAVKVTLSGNLVLYSLILAMLYLGIVPGALMDYLRTIL
jgi:NADH-quinone oxidoreductase subunit N